MQWPSDVTAYVTAQWRFKVRLTVALTLLFCVPYFTLQRVVLFPVRTLPLTALDTAVGFDPGWVWMYQSVYLLIGLVPWLATRRADLVRYARGFTALSLASFVCFLLVPVAGPRPAIVPTSGMFGLLISYDDVVNTIPSLHVGLAAYTVLFGARTTYGLLDASARQPLLVVGWCWVAAIAYSAMATKQHYVVDLPPGFLLAWLAHRWSWRDVREAVRSVPILEVGPSGSTR